MTPWLQGLNPDALLYDKTYGGVVTTNGLADPLADYGSGWYSDHHFHYGYFAYAAATLARLDVPYWEANRAPMETLIRDICNPDPTDPDFPFARHKDFFDGHSWASGLFQQANGKGQESSSEVLLSLFLSLSFTLSSPLTFTLSLSTPFFYRSYFLCLVFSLCTLKDIPLLRLLLFQYHV
jgi:endo-1,3(4)-beta-glucanase